MINYPGMLIMFGTGALCFYFFGDQINATEGISTILISIGLGWLYWSFMITKWRLWAFENVDDVYELESEAVEQNLIWKEGSIFEKTEIRTKEEQKQWEIILKRFEE